MYIICGDASLYALCAQCVLDCYHFITPVPIPLKPERLREGDNQVTKGVPNKVKYVCPNAPYVKIKRIALWDLVRTCTQRSQRMQYFISSREFERASCFAHTGL